MSAVIIVFLLWFAIVLLFCAVALRRASRIATARGAAAQTTPVRDATTDGNGRHGTAVSGAVRSWAARRRAAFGAAADGSVAAVGRVVTGAVVLLAGWSAVIIVCWPLGMLAHQVQGAIDEPTFRWWDARHLAGDWSRVWLKLTEIGSPTVTQSLAVAGAVVLTALYRNRAQWWAPAVIILMGYLAEKYSQTILKLVVHRGHPPTTLGSYPSGGMGRLEVIYGIIIYFVIWRYWRHSPRAWAIGGSVLAICASVQAYARLNNLEHWLTDVIGGAIYGLLLLAMLVLTHASVTRKPTVSGRTPPRSRRPVPGQVESVLMAGG